VASDEPASGAVARAGCARADDDVVGRGPYLVIGLQPGPEPHGNERCRAEKNVFGSQVQFVHVVDRPIVEVETVRDARVLDVIPLKTHGEAPVRGPIREPEPVNPRQLERDPRLSKQHSARRHSENDSFAGRPPGPDVDLWSLSVDTADAPAL
jgi:hypothetical protein